MRIVWRGGRSHKKATTPKATDTAKPNGADKDAVMIIDSDDEVSQEPEADVEPEFEEEEEEIDPDSPYPAILQHLDLSLGTAVTRIAVPPPNTSDKTSNGGPSILRSKMVLAVTCADHLVRVITLPLAPPSPASKARGSLLASSTAGQAGSGKWGESVTTLSGHSMLVDNVSMTFTASAGRSAENNETKRSRSRGATDSWSILVASHSKAVSGLLLIHRLPISGSADNDALYTFPSTSSSPIQTRYLSSYATSLAFNTSMHSSHRSTHLMVADKSSACKIYDCSPLPTDSDPPPNFATQGGSWLITLFPGFQSVKPEHSDMAPSSMSNYGRKTIIDAKWVLDGKAIIVLLADGEWGIWDIEGAQPGSSKGLLSGPSLRGGAITSFNLSGWIDGAPIKSSSRGHQMTGKFAPMTPGARKSAESAFFAPRVAQDAHGTISVTRLPGSIGTIDESIAIWLEDSYVVIPSLSAYWEAQRSRSSGQGSLFNGTAKAGSKLVKFQNINLGGERCVAIDQIPRSGAAKSSVPVDLLVSAEHRFIIVSDGPMVVQQAKKVSTSQALIASRPLAPEMGLLDVDDIDQALDMMDEDTPIKKGRKGVGFLI